jgi:5-methylcytosine-specific restriction endonuclease McrA
MPCRRPSLQKRRRAFDGRCFFCPEAAPEALQCHRIVPGEQGGAYRWENALTLCATCHAKVTAGTIVVRARRLSTAGPVIECVVDGVEKFIREWDDEAEGRE